MREYLHKISKKVFALTLSFVTASALVGTNIHAENMDGADVPVIASDVVDREVDPQITIQSFLHFDSVKMGYIHTLGSNNQGTITYPNNVNEVTSDWNMDAWNTSGDPAKDLTKQGNTDYKKTESGTILRIYNMEARNNTISNGKDTQAKYGLLLDANQNIDTFKTYKRIFQDKVDVDFLDYPQLKYMDLLGNNPNYRLSQLWIPKSGTSLDSIVEDEFTIYNLAEKSGDPQIVFTNNPNYQEDGRTIDVDQPTDYGDHYAIYVSDQSTYRFVYEPTSGDYTQDGVNFFDYNITDGGFYTTTNVNGDPVATSQQDSYYNKNRPIYIRTAQNGINSPENYSGTGSKLMFGNANTGTVGRNNTFGNTNTFNKYNQQNSQGTTFGLVSGLNADGSLKWNESISAPNLFGEKSVKGKVNYTNDEYNLGFSRTGGTYILDHVGNTSTTNLQTFQRTARGVISNQFWPMDSAPSYGTNGNDIKFGINTPRSSSQTNANQGTYLFNYRGGVPTTGSNVNQNSILPVSDDLLNHNAYFGMSFTRDFYIDPGYSGPLRYYFYGDDDMYVFLSKVNADGSLSDTKLIADLGGVHSSVGTYVNLWDFVNDKQGPIPYSNENERASNQTQHYRLSFFYTERGSAGSTCYMRFTLPFEPNMPEAIQYNADLNVDKEVKFPHGEDAATSEELQKAYSFKVTLKNREPQLDEDGQIIRDEQGNIVYKSLDDSSALVNRYSYQIRDLNKTENQVLSSGTIGSGETFTLKHGERFTLQGLPAGTLYKVEELNEDGSIRTTFVSGSIDEKGDTIVNTDFTNGNEVSGSTEEENYVKFINATQPATLTLSKKVTGTDRQDEFTFTIRLTDANGNPIDRVSILKNGEQNDDLVSETNDGNYTLTLKPNDTFVFYDLPAGTLYQIVEGENDQYVPDDIAIEGNGTVSENIPNTGTASGSLSTSTGIPNASITYTNRFTPNTSVVLDVTKNLSGRPAMEEETFTFTLEGNDDLSKELLNNEILTTSLPMTSGTTTYTGQFAPIRFTQPGTYTFKVQEQVPENQGIADQLEYDPSTYIATITIDENYTSKVEIQKDGEVVEGLSFTNVYKPETTLAIGITKNILGPIKAGDTYRFEISAKEGTPLPETKVIEIKAPIEGTITTGNFDPITYTQAGTYTYTIKEKDSDPNDNLYTDQTEYKVVVKVEKLPGTTDTLNASITSIEPDPNQNGSIQFTNVYQSVDVTIPFIKTLEGRQMNENDRFEFQLRDGNDVIDTITLHGVDGQNSIHGAFKPCTFTKAGIYSYQVNEVRLNDPSIVYDSNIYTVTIEVTENQETHQLEAKTTYTLNDQDQSIEFKNIYQTSTSWAPQISKQTIGGSTAGYTFEMKIEAEKGSSLENVSNPETKTAISQNDGLVTLDAFQFTKPGTYTVTIQEQTPEGAEDGVVDGILYDKKTIKYNVVVTRDEVTGALSVNAILPEGENATFTNDQGLLIEKRLTAGNGVTLSPDDLAQEFEFTLNLSSKGDYTAIRSDGDRLTVSDGSTFTLRGGESIRIYGLPIGTNYSISEASKEGYLLISSTNTEGEIGTGSAIESVFTNVKKGMDTGVIQGYKQLTNGPGSNASLQAGAYRFTIEGHAVEFAPDAQSIEKGPEMDVEEEEEPTTPIDMNVGSMPMPSQTIVSNGVNGEFAFPEIEFQYAGTYVYRISEVNDGQPGVTYDPNAFLAAVNVVNTTDAEGHVNGVKVDSITYSDLEGNPIDAIEFTNHFEGTPALEIHKHQSLNHGTMTQDLLQAEAGDYITYFLTASVPESATASALNVVIKDIVPVSEDGVRLTYINSILGNGSYDEKTNEITWDLGEMAPGSVVTVAYTVQVPQVKANTKWTNVATITSDNTPPDESEEVEVETEPRDPHLEIFKEQSKNGEGFTTDRLHVDSNDLVTYQLTVQNTGEAVAKNVVVSDQVPDGLELIEGTISHKGTADRNGKITWEIGDLLPGNSFSVTFQVRVPKITEKKEWTNVGAVRYDNPPTDEPEQEGDIPSNEVVIDSDVPEIVIEKEQAVNGDDFTKDELNVAAKDLVTYRLNITNTSQVVAKNVVVTDTIPAQLNYVPNSASHGGNNVNGTITWALGDLQPGEIRQVTFQVTVPKVEQATMWTNIGSSRFDNDPEGEDHTISSNQVVIKTDVKHDPNHPNGGKPSSGSNTAVSTNVKVWTGLTGIAGMSVLVLVKNRKNRQNKKKDQ